MPQSIPGRGGGVPRRCPTVNAKPRVLLIGPRHGGMGGVAMFDEIILGSPLQERFEIIHLDTSRTAAGAGKASTLAPINFFYALRQTLQLIGVLIMKRPRIVHQPITAGVSFWKEAGFIALARLFGAHTIGHLHSGRLAPMFEKAGRLKRAWIRAALGRPNLLITLSEHARGELLDLVDPSLETAVVPNTVEPDVAALARAGGPPAGEGANPHQVLSLSSLNEAKGFFDAVEAARLVRVEMPGARFVFAGAVKFDAERGRIDSAMGEAAKRGDAEFVGEVRDRAKIDLLRNSALFLFLSHAENLPIAVLEAMAAGLPLVVTPVGALPEFLEDGRNARFVPTHDPEAAARAVAHLLRDPVARREMGEANRQRFIELFSPDAVFRRMETVYCSILEEI